MEEIIMNKVKFNEIMYERKKFGKRLKTIGMMVS